MRRWGLVRPCVAFALGAIPGSMLLGSGVQGEEQDPLAPLRPHPIISEVLFNVPNSEAGDADRDGARSATGDEFVEILNPHSKPVNLKGYTLTNRLSTGDATGKKGVRFTFPALELPPGAVVVVFNGFASGLDGPVGTADRAPDKVHPGFGKAAVFSMGNGAKNRAWSNSGDFVLLSAPDDTPIDAIWWASAPPKPPADALRIAEVAPNPKGSVQRPSPGADPVPHIEIDGTPCSPGTVPQDRDAKP